MSRQCMDNPFELNAVFRLTRAGCTMNQATGMINAEAFHNMPWNDGFLVTAFESSDQHNDVEIRLVSQKPPQFISKAQNLLPFALSDSEYDHTTVDPHVSN